MKCVLFTSCVLVFYIHTVQNTILSRSLHDVDVRELEITSDVALRYAKVLVKSVMINRKSADQEVTFQVKLPKEAYITSFVIATDNRTIEAVIKEKKKAQEAYDKAKEDNVTAGLVSHQGVRDDLDLDIFEIEVNVAGDTEVEFRLEYEEFLQRRAEKYSQKLFIDLEQVIPSLEVKCSFKEKQKFKYFSYKTPYLKQRVIYEEGVVSKDGYYVNTIDWKPSTTEQEVASVGLEAPFVVEYELELEDNGGMVFMNNDGNFVHLFSVPCDESNVMRKQIVFVIDISGSMSGNPIHQVREAMTIILSQLRSTDYFNIIIFDDISAKWETSFQQANPDNTNAAKLFIQKYVKASGSTNINDALLSAIDLFSRSNSVERYGQIIVFLTDGEPTHGITDTSAIRQNVRDRNYVREECCKSTINTIAFGRNADINFLQLIAYENAGTLTIIKEIESNVADGELISMYNEIANPYYKNLVFSFEVDGAVLPETNITQAHFRQYDCKGELVISGQTRPGEKVLPTVKVVGARDDFTFNNVPTILILDDESEMLTRLAVYQRVKYFLKEAEIALDANEREKANKVALELSLQYGFVTPLTSLIVTDYAPTQTAGNVDYGFESQSYDLQYDKRLPSGHGKADGAHASVRANNSDKLCLPFNVLVTLLVISKCFVTIL
ncbi:inter-alpha-trypsin inhibitor heavy chain H4-like [Mercenaria mercenaria]|uniref:inter-alpha-trypsin inhibitor heavy chain H4-like n=1 Tax=Mercenaria mercenaria TaxID=6596 RepID=UPI00234F65C4|nr:inter-alpha-trypsin inhibitor heavy chain H4-like [Mercenaria mercenaria]